jgi:hypothetical protein
MSHSHHKFVTTLIDRYGLEPDRERIDVIVADWLQHNDSNWVVQAIVESLYRGRYKIKSVDNILRDWQRLSKPLYHFTPEYEREILQNLPEIGQIPAEPLADPVEIDSASPASSPESDIPVVPIANFNSQDLNPEESAPFQHHDPNCILCARQIEHDRLGRIHLPRIGASQEKSLEILHSPIDRKIPPSAIRANVSRQNGQSSHHQSQPVNLQLFNTLKAIVDPNNQQLVKSPNSGSIDNTPLQRIAKFQLPQEPMSSELQM